LKTPVGCKTTKKNVLSSKNMVTPKTHLGGLGLASGFARGHHGLARLVLLGVDLSSSLGSGGERERKERKKSESEREGRGGDRSRREQKGTKKIKNQARNSRLTLGPLRASPASSALPALAWTCVE